MSVVRWNPIRELQEMNEMMDRFFDEPALRRERYSRAWRMPVDAYSTDDAIVLMAELPGVSEEDVNITLENNVLTISGAFKPREDDQNFFLKERFSGRFERVLSIGTPVNVSAAEASFENGILTLTLPKAEEVKPRTIQIKHKN
jgi:HSP20 family protein